MRFLFFLISTLFLTSCISSRKIDKSVSKYYNENPVSIGNDSVTWFSSQPQTAPIDTFSNSTRTKAQFIPALLYWQWHTNVNTSLNDQITINRFNEYLNSKSDSIELKKLIDNNTIKFSFEEIPSDFSYIHRGNTIILVFAYVINDLITIQPQPSNYTLNYSIIDNSGKVLHEGMVSTTSTEIPLENVWKSAKKFTWKYLDERHKHQNEAFRQLLNKIEKDLKNSELH